MLLRCISDKILNIHLSAQSTCFHTVLPRSLPRSLGLNHTSQPLHECRFFLLQTMFTATYPKATEVDFGGLREIKSVALYIFLYQTTTTHEPPLHVEPISVAPIHSTHLFLRCTDVDMHNSLRSIKMVVVAEGPEPSHCGLLPGKVIIQQ